MFLGGIFLFSSPEFILAGEICKKTHSIWSIWAPRAPFVISAPPIWGHHPVLDFHTQITRKSSTAMCYKSSQCYSFRIGSFGGEVTRSGRRLPGNGWSCFSGDPREISCQLDKLSLFFIVSFIIIIIIIKYCSIQYYHSHDSDVHFDFRWWYWALERHRLSGGVVLLRLEQTNPLILVTHNPHSQPFL